jgi:hypothetical protein
MVQKSSIEPHLWSFRDLCQLNCVGREVKVAAKALKGTLTYCPEAVRLQKYGMAGFAGNDKTSSKPARHRQRLYFCVFSRHVVKRHLIAGVATSMTVIAL